MFKASIGNDQLFISLNSECDRLLIEVVTSSKLEIRKKIISKQEEVRQITGAFFIPVKLSTSMCE